MDRRAVLAGLRATLGAGAAAGMLPARAQNDIPRWSSPVIDLHFHMRNPAQSVAHQVGAGITAANLLTSTNAAEQVAAVRAANPAMFPSWFASTNVSAPDAGTRFSAAVKAGAKGFGELKHQVEADGPEMRRVYALAAELDVPVLLHFQEIGQPAAPGGYNTGIKRFEAMLKAFPRTKFIGHGDAFWANISGDYAEKEIYPEGPIVPGGVIHKLLADYPNMYGDLSANSANNALSRDLGFTRQFLARNQDKLHFGSDCNCDDGRGGGAQRQSPAVAPRIRGKCVARETLRLLTDTTTTEIFRKIAWTNTHTLLGLPA
jgi:predicted TIM-barrel fold metal-dependent hydrolase